MADRQLPPLDPVGEDLKILADPELSPALQSSLIAAYKMGRQTGRTETLNAVKAIHASAG